MLLSETHLFSESWQPLINPFSQENRKNPLDVQCSVFSICHQQTLLLKKMGSSLQKHPDRKVNPSLPVNPSKIHLIHLCGSLYCSWHGLAQGTNLLFHKDPLIGTTDETFNPSSGIKWLLLPVTVIEKSICQLNNCMQS